LNEALSTKTTHSGRMNLYLVLFAFGVLSVTACQEAYVVQSSSKVELRELQAKALRAYQQCLIELQKTPTAGEESCARTQSGSTRWALL
jgi:hypothetical protein